MLNGDEHAAGDLLGKTITEKASIKEKDGKAEVSFQMSGGGQATFIVPTNEDKKPSSKKQSSRKKEKPFKGLDKGFLKGKGF